MTELLNQIGSTTISDFTGIAYDGIGNRNLVTANIPGATSLSGTTGYSYDSKDQITQETSTRNGGFTDDFGYDSAGNPTNFKGVTKSYNSNNQQTGTGFSHDGNGNPTNYGGSTLTFDPENRVTAYGSVLAAGYTGDGLRAWKQNASGRTYFLYDGIVPIVELDSSGAITATSTFGAAGLVSRREGNTSVFYSFDSEGNVAQRSDSSGTTLSNHLFSAHGSILGASLSDPFGYKAQFGYYTDNETGLQLLTHRYYDGLVGRFITRDPISYGGGINLYSYVTNRTPNAIDPSGLERLNYTLQPGQPPPPIPTNPIRLPDFFSGQVNVGLGPLVPFGWSGQVILDRKGNLYLQPLGFNGGKSFTFVSGAITAGWINQRCEPSERELGNVLNDQSIGGGGGFIGGVEFTANKSGSTTQVGAMSPQIGGSWGHTTKVGNLGIGW